MKGLKLSIAEKIKFLLSSCGFFQISKIKDLKEVTGRIKRKTDIIYIIKKLIELDKLKLLLLNENQLKLFDYLPKPRIQSLLNKSKDTNDLFHSRWVEHFEEENSNAVKANRARQAFFALKQKSEKNELDQKLLEMIETSLAECRLSDGKKDVTFTDLNIEMKSDNQEESVRIPKIFNSKDNYKL